MRCASRLLVVGFTGVGFNFEQFTVPHLLEVVRFEDAVLTLRLTGTLNACPGTAYVKRGVIEPAVKKAAGAEVEVVYERPSMLD